MRNTLPMNAVTWLRSSPLPIAAPQNILSAFSSGTIKKVVKFKGPHTFYRMAGWNEKDQKMADPWGCWWIEEQTLHAIYTKISRLDMFEGWMPPDMLRRVKSLPMHYRALTAVCTDWNDFREQIELRLPANEELIGLCGMVAPQPLKSTMNPKSRKAPILPGGIEQVYFKRGNANRKNIIAPNINPFWVRWIKLW